MKEDSVVKGDLKKESAWKMKNALKLFRPHLLCAPLPEHFLVRQHGGQEGAFKASKHLFFFPPFSFFSIPRKLRLCGKKRNRVYNKETSKGKGKALNVRFNHAIRVCLF